MAEQRADDLPRDVVFTSESYRQDLVNVVMYAVIGVVLLVCTLFWFAFIESRSGAAGAAGVASTTPLSFGQAMRVAHICGYFMSFASAVSFFVVGYSGVVRPLQRATGMLDSSGTGGADGSRASISIEMTDGTQTFQPDAECVACEDRAIGVLATGYEQSRPTTAVPVCPMHLHERREEYEAQSQRVEVETFV